MRTFEFYDGYYAAYFEFDDDVSNAEINKCFEDWLHDNASYTEVTNEYKD